MSNREKEKWIILDYGDIKIHIVRAGDGNRKYSEIARKRLSPYKRQVDNGTLNPEIALRVMAGIYADSVVVGWEGAKDSGGQSLSFTRNNVVKYLVERRDLLGSISLESLNPSNFSVEM